MGMRASAAAVRQAVGLFTRDHLPLLGVPGYHIPLPSFDVGTHICEHVEASPSAVSRRRRRRHFVPTARS